MNRSRLAVLLPGQALALGVMLGLALTLTACDSKSGSSEPTKTPSATKTTEAPPLQPTLTTDKVDAALPEQVGPLGEEMVAVITPLIATYVDQSFISFAADAPKYDAFTPGAVALAQAQASTVTRAGFGSAEKVRATRLNGALEVFAPGGQPVGVTARIDFAFDVDGREATLTGRLLISPEAEGWRIFGFDLTQNAPDPLPATPTTTGAAQ